MSEASSSQSAPDIRDVLQRRPILVPTLTKQSWLFMIGSALFALGSAPGQTFSAETNNFLFFIGAWFFTAAGLLQLVRSGEVTVPVGYPPGKMFRAEWLAAATQSFGTIMFNISTTSALHAKTVDDEKHFVWNPDAGGSVAFLLSAVFVIMAYTRTSKFWEPTKVAWWSGQINMLGCIAFGVSAVGAFIEPNGAAANSGIANIGTFIGALCFFLASFIALPQLKWNHASAIAGFEAFTKRQSQH